jgi:hypothetical protein
MKKYTYTYTVNLLSYRGTVTAPNKEQARALVEEVIRQQFEWTLFRWQGIDSLRLVGTHPLLPRKLERTIPPLYSQEQAQDPIVRAHYFTPAADWYVIEHDALAPDGMVHLCYGLVSWQDEELGYFTLDELREAGAEHDRNFTPRKLSEVRKG